MIQKKRDFFYVQVDFMFFFIYLVLITEQATGIFQLYT